MRRLIIISTLAFVSLVHAATPDDLFGKAMREGVADGELSGPVADRLKTQTHSTSTAAMHVEKGVRDSDGCQHFTMKMVQPHVPTRDGKDAGDYMTLNKIKFCYGGQDPVAEVVDCKVGTVSCMPKK